MPAPPAPLREGITDDRSHPGLRETLPSGQQKTYLVLSEEERAKGFVRPLRRSYQHVAGEHPCGAITNMGLALCETYAREPTFYGATFCARCHVHYPVADFTWVEDGEPVGS